jgi:Xaa-Pro aminopeptidase
MQLQEIQSALRAANLDGWLFFDHHERDPLAYRILGFQPERSATRRWYYLIPATGDPQGLVHGIEAGMLDALPGEKVKYSSWQKQREGLSTLLTGCRKIAMQYSPECAVPYVSFVDAGTVELVRSLGVDVVSSADLVQYFEARWSDQQLETHLEAGSRVDKVVQAAFQETGARIARGEQVNEWDIKQFILTSFGSASLFTDHGPIVAVNANASNPHYEPTQEQHLPIRKGDNLLIDLWAKLDVPDSVYYDITWTGFMGDAPPSDVENVFEIVTGGRDAAIARVKKAVSAKEPLAGYQVDDAAREFIQAKGFAEYFIHRTGHSIGRDVHGAGANMDNLETHDTRRVIARTGFSVEPGIYLPAFGIRSEINMYVGDTEAIVTGEIQRKLLRINAG